MSVRLSKTLCSFAMFACGSAAFAQTAAPLPPIDAHERTQWLLAQNVSAGSVLATVAVAGIQTATNSPEEYGPHWEGFAKRAGLIVANYGVNSTMEVGLGAIWGEDPRYDQTEGKPFGARVKHVFVRTFTARNRTGDTMPAYSRFLSIPGSCFLANQWMPDSQATASEALFRTGLGFLGRLGGNAWKEFIRRRK